MAGARSLTSGVRENMTTNFATPFAGEENECCAGFLQSHQAPQGWACWLPQASSRLLNPRLNKLKSSACIKKLKREQVKPALQWSQQIAKTLSLGKAVEGGFGNLARVA